MSWSPPDARQIAWYCLLVFAGGIVKAEHPSSVSPATSVESVAEEISRQVSAACEQAGVISAPPCSDREFVRRVYLDLAGQIPKVAEVENFLADDRDDKRRHLIESLTASEDYAIHFADSFDTLLMGRGNAGDYRNRNQHGWRRYLEEVFRQNRPWNTVVQEIVLARPSNDTDQAAFWFLYDRRDKHQEIAEAVAPAVFGIRVECAQCHDHPLADEILQQHYWGLVAFFNRSKNVNTKNGPRVSESAIGGFSEFADLTGDSQPNLLSFFQAEVIAEPRPEKGAQQEDRDDLYQPSAFPDNPRVPNFSRREKFAKQVVAAHPLVARAMVNRLWALMMGRGIVHPHDEMDSVHEPSHAQLLDRLADDFRESGFDIRRLVRAIALSEPYQRSSRRPDAVDDPATFAWYLERPLTAEQLARSMQVALHGRFRNDHPLLGQLRQQFKDVLPEENVTRIKDALFLSNNPSVQRFINESNQPHHLVPQLQQIESTSQQVALLFQTVFSRPPTADEQEAVIAYLDSNSGEKQQRWRQVVWSLLASAEFRFNH
ncbi:MAG: DUF1549 and DUF1553 domain-containing protein [Pirellulales bacterium]|nr:DUF1549 and DUF1553 domain-containing protein [Pirellulales bacterium]